MKLYTANLCPYAQRVHALLLRLQIPYEHIEIDLDARDTSFLALTPTGRVPLLCDGDLRLYESTIILEYLADRAGWVEALPGDAQSRARQRLGMLRWDEAILPAFYAALQGAWNGPPNEQCLEAELAELESTLVQTEAATDSLLGYHCAPHWIRMRWLGQSMPLFGSVISLPILHNWLDDTLDLKPIKQTLPLRHDVVSRYQSMRTQATTASD